MRLISTLRAQEGATLSRDVMIGRADGVPLLRAGVRLTARYRDLLIKSGVSAVYINDEASEGIEVVPVLDDATRSVAARAVAGAFDSARNAMTSGAVLDPERLRSLHYVVDSILEQIEAAGGAAVALADLSSADSYTFQHSINVTAVGLLVGHRYFAENGWVDFAGNTRHGDIDSRLSTLGLGLLLHDIGKLAVPLGILNKPGKLTSQEWEIIKTHPRAGVDMLEGKQWSPLVKAVVLRHHERWNGSGYPDGRSGDAIHQMARIAAVADVYDAITSERLYAPARPACDGVRAILQGSGTLFDPGVVEAFLRVVAPFPPGTEVELTDGRRGLVQSVPDGAPDRPVVRILEGDVPVDEVALLTEPSLGIVGWNVEFPLPAPAAAA